jgi:hypothetical protein
MADGDVCIANIGPRERRQRMGFGIISAVLALVALGLLAWGHVIPGWRVLLFLPWFIAGVGVFQATGKT